MVMAFRSRFFNKQTDKFVKLLSSYWSNLYLIYIYQSLTTVNYCSFYSHKNIIVSNIPIKRTYFSTHVVNIHWQTFITCVCCAPCANVLTYLMEYAYFFLQTLAFCNLCHFYSSYYITFIFIMFLFLLYIFSIMFISNITVSCF